MARSIPVLPLLLYSCLLLNGAITTRATAEPNKCESPGCVNGKPSIVHGECVCSCEPGFMGPNCDREDECVTDNPCYHGGKCSSRPDGQLFCDCPLGYLSPDCRDRDPCVDKGHHCRNGATCQRLDDIDFSCACALPYEGDHCERRNLCLLDGGECLDTNTILDEDAPLCFPCSEHIVARHGCVREGDDGDEKYLCNCLPGWIGPTCELAANQSTPLTSITLPLTELAQMRPHDFFIQNAMLPREGLVVFIVKTSSPDFRIHITVMDNFRPDCDSILSVGWDFFLPSESGDNFGIFNVSNASPPPRIDRNSVSNTTEAFGFYVNLWPESSKSFGEDVEVTFQYGIFKLNCFSPPTADTGDSSNNDNSIRSSKNDCFASDKDTGKKRVSCDCIPDLQYETLTTFLAPVEYRTETYVPIELMENVCPFFVIPWIVLSFSILYVLLLLLICPVDHRNKRGKRLVVMTDVQRIQDEFFYLLTVQTGNHPFARSSANICCQIYGTLARTRPLVLADHKLHALLRQDDEVNYLFSSEVDLGEIKSVRLWHDHVGASPNWYLRKVIVKDLRREERWFFLVDKWLSVLDSTIIWTVDACSGEEAYNYIKGSCRNALRYQFRDWHLFLSPVLACPTSRVCRSERLTLLFTAIFIHMIILICFYGFPESIHPIYHIDWESHVFFDSTVILYGLLASLVSLVVITVFGLLFRCVADEKVPTILVCEAKKAPPRPPPPLPKELRRWAELDPNREMVVGVPKEAESLLLGGPPPPELELKEEYLEFRIPSTSISHTETWIASHVTHERQSDDPVQSLPPDPVKEPYKRILNDGLVGAVVSLKDADKHSLVYQPQEEDLIDDLIAKDIRANFNQPHWPRPEYFAEVKEEEELLLLQSSSSEPRLLLVDQGTQTSLPNILTPDMSSDNKGVVEVVVEKPQARKKPGTLFVELCAAFALGKSSVCCIGWRILCWALCVLLIIGSGGVTGWFGARYGVTRTMGWIYSFIWSFIFSFCLSLLIHVFLFALILHSLKRSDKVMSHEDAMDRSRLQLVWLQGTCDLPGKVPLDYILFLESYYYKPLTSHKMFFDKMDERRTLRLQRNTIGMILFFIFIVCLLFMGSFLRSSQYYGSVRSVESALKMHEDQMNWPDSFMSIMDTATFYEYLRGTFLENLHGADNLVDADRTFHDFPPTDDAPLVWLSDHVTLLIGAVRLRQQRVKNNMCPANWWVKRTNLSISCDETFRDSLVRSTKDTASYSEGWTQFKRSTPSSTSSRGHSLKWASEKGKRWAELQRVNEKGWQWQPATATGSWFHLGALSTYDGSGYVVQLSREKEYSLKVVDDLEAKGWVNEKTRAVFIEFMTYNPEARLYNVHKFVAERSSYNSWVTSKQTGTHRFRTEPMWDLSGLELFVLCTFIVCVIYFTVQLVLNTVEDHQRGVSSRQGCGCVSSNLDLVIIIGSIYILIMYFVGRKLSSELMDKLQNTRDFVNFQTLSMIYTGLLYGLVVVTLLCGVKCWILFIPSYRRWYVVGLTLSLTVKQVAAFLIYFFIVLVAFSCFTHLAFGTYSARYRTFTQSLISLLQITKVAAAVSYRTVEGYNIVLGPIFYFTYYAFAYFLSINIVISVLTMGLQEAEDSAKWRDFRHTYIRVIRLKILSLVTLATNHKKHGGAKNQQQPSNQTKKDSSSNPRKRATLEDIPTDRMNAMKRATIQGLETSLKIPQALATQQILSRTETLINPRKQRVLSKIDKLEEWRQRHMKIPSERLKDMKSLTIHLIKTKTGHDFGRKDMQVYNDYDFEFVRKKHEKLQRALNRLEIVVEAKQGRPRDEEDELLEDGTQEF